MSLSERFRDALSCATEADAGQIHKGTPIPYRAHLFGATGIALEYGADEGEAIAVLLHDAGEDACMCLAWRPRCSAGFQTCCIAGF